MLLLLRPLAALAVVTLSISMCSAAADPEATDLLVSLDRQIQQGPGNPRLLAARGLLLARLGRDKESLRAFQEALRISPKFLVALEGAAEVAYRQSDSEAAPYVTRILAQDPANPTAQAMAGAIAFSAGRCGEAMQHFAAAGSAVTGNSNALLQWGKCLLDAHQPRDAADRLRRSLLLADTDAARFDLVLALAQAGEINDALGVAARLPSSSDVLNLKASLYVAQKSFAQAVSSYREAITLDPLQDRNYIDLASLCLEHESLDAAKEVIDAGLTALPESAALYTLRGTIAAQSSQMESAAADFDKALELKPDQLYSDAGLSLLLEQKAEIDQAISIVRGRLSKAPQSAALQFLLSDLLLKRSNSTPKDHAEALTHAREAIKLDDTMAQAHSLLGRELLRSGETDSAIAELRRALSIDPRDRVALNQLVLAYRKAGRTEEARLNAVKLQKVLQEDRIAEVQNNSVHFVSAAKVP